MRASVAHEGDDPLSRWYKSLYVPSGIISCCNISDCHPTEAKMVDDHWEIPSDVEGEPWDKVPAKAVLKRENMEGRPVVCRSPDTIRYFVPPVQY